MGAGAGVSMTGVGTTGEGSFVVDTTGDLFPALAPLPVPTTGDTGLPIKLDTVGEIGLIEIIGDVGFRPAPPAGLGGAVIRVDGADEEFGGGRGPNTVLGAGGALAG